MRHAGEHKATLRVCLVLTLGAQVKVHASVRVEDWLDTHMLPVVFRVFVVRVFRPQPPCSKPSHHRFFKSIVVGFLSTGRLLVCAIQTGTRLSQLIFFLAFARHKVHPDPVVPVLVNDPLHRHVHLVHLKPWLVLELVPKRSLPLRPDQRTKPPVLHAVHPLLVQSRLDLVELDPRLLVNFVVVVFHRLKKLIIGIVSILLFLPEYLPGIAALPKPLTIKYRVASIK